MGLEGKFLTRVGEWESMSRWERSELGRDLRRAGLSYGEIMELIPVKKSTLATWCRDVRLSDAQIEAIGDRTSQESGEPRDTQWRRWKEIEAIRRDAATQVSDFRDPLWLAGVTLYWAEGSKTRNQLRLANTDPDALRLFVSWIRAFVDASAQFSIQLHLHEGNDELSAMEYWCGETGLHEANFYKTYIKPKGTGHRKNHLPWGVCTLKVRRCADGWHQTMAWIGELPSHLGLSKAH